MITTMIELFFDCPPLLFAIYEIKFKTFILRLKIIRLLFERSVLIRRQRDALFENGRRAVLCDEFFNSVEKSHLKPPNVI